MDSGERRRPETGAREQVTPNARGSTGPTGQRDLNAADDAADKGSRGHDRETPGNDAGRRRRGENESGGSNEKDARERYRRGYRRGARRKDGASRRRGRAVDPGTARTRRRRGRRGACPDGRAGGWTGRVPDVLPPAEPRAADVRRTRPPRTGDRDVDRRGERAEAADRRLPALAIGHTRLQRKEDQRATGSVKEHGQEHPRGQPKTGTEGTSHGH